MRDDKLKSKKFHNFRVRFQIFTNLRNTDTEGTCDGSKKAAPLRSCTDVNQPKLVIKHFTTKKQYDPTSKSPNTNQKLPDPISLV